MDDINFENLDDSWINEINEDEAIFNKFYTSTPNYVNLYITYLDDNNHIVHIKTSTTSLKDSVLPKSKLIYYISKYSHFHKKKYKCVDIIKYNIDIDSKRIQKYIDHSMSYNYLSQVSKTDDIHWKNSVEILHPINSLYIFFKQYNHTNKRRTKKKLHFTRKKTRKQTY